MKSCGTPVKITVSIRPSFWVDAYLTTDAIWAVLHVVLHVVTNVSVEHAVSVVGVDDNTRRLYVPSKR